MKSARLRKNEILYSVVYTLVYLAITCLICLAFLRQGKSMVYHYDGWYQHIRALTCYGEWLRGGIRSLLSGNGLPTWSFGIGYGSDVLTTLSYYCIGDPLTLLSAFFRRGSTIYLYHFLLLFRPWLGGLFFSFYCFYRTGDAGPGGAAGGRGERSGKREAPVKNGEDGACGIGRTCRKRNYIIILAAAIAYDFSEVTLYLGRWHPYFIIPLVVFPLLLLGAERAFRERKYGLYILAVFLGGISNFYFFYMEMIFTVLYVLVRAWDRKRVPLLQYGKKVLCFVPATLAGTGLAAVLLVPVVIQFLDNPRSGLQFALPPLYEPEYYRDVLRYLITFKDHPLYDTQLGLAVPAALMLLMLFVVKGHRKLKTAGALSIAALLLPFGGHVLNGFSYVINRWTFAIVLLACWSLVCLWEEIGNLSVPRAAAFAGLCAAYAAALKLMGFLDGEDLAPRDNTRLSAALILVCAALVLLHSLVRSGLKPARTDVGAERSAEGKALAGPQMSHGHSGNNTRTDLAGLLALCLCVTSVCANIYYGYDGNRGAFPQDFLDRMDAEGFQTALEDTEAAAVAKAAGNEGITESLYRFSGSDLAWNSGVPYGISSTDFYFSLANGNISEFLNRLGVKEQFSFGYQGLDERFILNTLGDVRYYVISAFDEAEVNRVPYGFMERTDNWDGEEPWTSVTNYRVFENVLPLSAGLRYKTYTPESEFLQQDLPHRQELLTQSVVVSDEDAAKLSTLGYAKGEPAYTQKQIPLTITCGDGASWQGSTGSGRQSPAEDTAGDTAAVSVQGTAGGSIVTTEDNAEITLTLQADPVCETYLVLGNLTADDGENARFPITFTGTYEDGTELTKDLLLQTPKSQFYSNWHDFLINFGVRQSGVRQIRIVLPYAGIYTFDDFRVVCQPMESAAALLNDKLSEPLTDVDVHRNGAFATNRVTGNVSLQEDALMLLSIPYSRGWSARVDGVKTELMQADIMYLALPASAGQHTLELTYHTPGLLPGTFVSVVSLLLVIVYAVCSRRRRQSP